MNGQSVHEKKYTKYPEIAGEALLLLHNLLK